jgi:hypothetical protein
MFPAYQSKLDRYRVLYQMDQERLSQVARLAVNVELMRQAHAVYLRRFPS